MRLNQWIRLLQYLQQLQRLQHLQYKISPILILKKIQMIKDSLHANYPQMILKRKPQLHQLPKQIIRQTLVTKPKLMVIIKKSQMMKKRIKRQPPKMEKILLKRRNQMKRIKRLEERNEEIKEKTKSVVTPSWIKFVKAGERKIKIKRRDATNSWKSWIKRKTKKAKSVNKRTRNLQLHNKRLYPNWRIEEKLIECLRKRKDN